MKDVNNIVEKLKSLDWGIAVRRPGFLQPKSILNEAETKEFILYEDITIQYDTVFWVNEIDFIYDQPRTYEFSEQFDLAFLKNKWWPLAILEKFDSVDREIQIFLKKISKIDLSAFSYGDLKDIFERYIALLKDVQHFYVLGVPLTDYCEQRLMEQKVEYLNFAHPYKKLGVDELEESLHELYKSDMNSAQLHEHMRKFAWVKTNYNIVNTYTEDDIKNSVGNIEGMKSKIKKSENEYISSMQIGIYIRNRIKELSQQLWYAIDPYIIELSKYLSLTRNDFLQHSVSEIMEVLSTKKSILSEETIRQRDNGFAIGILDRKEFLFVGSIVDELYNHFDSIDSKSITKIQGRIACKGKMQGAVKVISDYKDFDSLKKGDILVTSMTTPDFVVIMKKAGAIVTDEGGLSCHAAIVSRELGVPCIIGTKIATQVLKDGDIIEVDANNGIVRKIDR